MRGDECEQREDGDNRGIHDGELVGDAIDKGAYREREWWRWPIYALLRRRIAFGFGASAVRFV